METHNGAQKRGITAPKRRIKEADTGTKNGNTKLKI
jgi:hypothetical protein